MASVTVIDAHPDHIEAFRSGCRAADRREWETALGSDLETAMRIAVRYPMAVSRVALDSKTGEVLAMWGGHKLQGGGPGVGQLWFAGRDAAYAKVHGIHHHWRREIGDLHKRWPILVAFADERQVRHHAWIERMGFERRPGVIHFGPENHPYRIYRRTA